MAWTKAKSVITRAVVLASLVTAPLVVHQYVQSQHPDAHLPDCLSKGSLAEGGNEGYETPEAALKTLLWAMTQANYPAVMASATPEQRAKMESELKDEDSKDAFVAKMKSNSAHVTGFKITGHRTISPGVIVVDVRTEGVDKSDEWTFRRIGAEWKFEFPQRTHDITEHATRNTQHGFTPQTFD